MTLNIIDKPIKEQIRALILQRSGLYFRDHNLKDLDQAISHRGYDDYAVKTSDCGHFVKRESGDR